MKIIVLKIVQNAINIFFDIRFRGRHKNDVQTCTGHGEIYVFHASGIFKASKSKTNMSFLSNLDTFETFFQLKVSKSLRKHVHTIYSDFLRLNNGIFSVEIF